MSETDKQAIEAIRLLRSNLIWSRDFDLIREPLANLLEILMQLPTHDLDEPIDALTRELTRLEPTDAYRDQLEAWVRKVEQSIQQVEAQNNRNIFQRIFRRF